MRFKESKRCMIRIFTSFIAVPDKTESYDFPRLIKGIKIRNFDEIQILTSLILQSISLPRLPIRKYLVIFNLLIFRWQLACIPPKYYNFWQLRSLYAKCLPQKKSFEKPYAKGLIVGSSNKKRLFVTLNCNNHLVLNNTSYWNLRSAKS